MINKNHPIRVSFEFFPPKNKDMELSLWKNIKRLEPLNPQFVSVTYGAGGSTRDRTHELVKDIKSKTSIEPAAHLTCVNSGVEEILQIADKYWNDGIRHIVALRGDKTIAGEKSKNRLKYATDLIKLLKNCNNFDITVSAYPECHPDSKNMEQEFDILKKKIDLGATKAITQFFFDTEKYIEFVDKAIKKNIKIPIIPGILPITNFRRTLTFSKATNCSIPPWIKRMFKGLDSDPKTRELIAASVAAEQCQKILKEGINEFHFYTLNRADLSFAICHILENRFKIL